MSCTGSGIGSSFLHVKDMLEPTYYAENSHKPVTRWLSYILFFTNESDGSLHGFVLASLFSCKHMYVFIFCSFTENVLNV